MVKDRATESPLDRLLVDCAIVLSRLFDEIVVQMRNNYAISVPIDRFHKDVLAVLNGWHAGALYDVELEKTNFRDSFPRDKSIYQSDYSSCVLRAKTDRVTSLRAVVEGFSSDVRCGRYLHFCAAKPIVDNYAKLIRSYRLSENLRDVWLSVLYFDYRMYCYDIGWVRFKLRDWGRMSDMFAGQHYELWRKLMTQAAQGQHEASLDAIAVEVLGRPPIVNFSVPNQLQIPVVSYVGTHDHLIQARAALRSARPFHAGYFSYRIHGVSILSLIRANAIIKAYSWSWYSKSVTDWDRGWISVFNGSALLQCGDDLVRSLLAGVLVSGESIDALIEVLTIGEVFEEVSLAPLVSLGRGVYGLLFFSQEPSVTALLAGAYFSAVLPDERAEKGSNFEGYVHRMVGSAIRRNSIIKDVCVLAPVNIILRFNRPQGVPGMEVDLLLRIYKTVLVCEMKCVSEGFGFREERSAYRSILTAVRQLRRRIRAIRIDDACLLSVLKCKHFKKVGYKVLPLVVLPTDRFTGMVVGGCFVVGYETLMDYLLNRVCVNDRGGLEEFGRWQQLYTSSSDAGQEAEEYFRSPPRVKQFRESTYRCNKLMMNRDAVLSQTGVGYDFPNLYLS